MEDQLDVSYDEHGYFLFLDIYGPIGLIINFLGVVTILMRSTAEMGAYKWYLLNYQIWGTLIDAGYSFIQPEMLFPIPGGRTIGYNVVMKIDEHASMVTLFCFTAGSGAALLTCFIYRYNVVISSFGRCLTKRQMFLLAVFLHSFMILTIGGLFYLAAVPYDVATKHFCDACSFFHILMKQKYPYLEKILTGYGKINVYWPDHNPIIKVFVAYVIAVTTAVGIIISILYSRTIANLQKLRNMMSERVYRTNYSLTFTLIMQMVVPYSLLILPVLVMTTLIIGVGMAFLAMMTTHASGNTLVLMTLVKSYRNFVFYWPLVAFRVLQRVGNAVSSNTRVMTKRGGQVIFILAPGIVHQNAPTTTIMMRSTVAVFSIAPSHTVNDPDKAQCTALDVNLAWPRLALTLACWFLQNLVIVASDPIFFSKLCENE